MAKQYQFPKRPIRKKQRKQEKKFGTSNRKKLLLVFAILLLFICVLIGRLLYINLSNSDTYARIVMAQMDYDSKSIPFKRGDIQDRNGTVLATSEKVYNLVLDPYVVLNSNGDCEEPTAEAIEKYFGIDASEVYKILDESPDSRYVVMAKQLDYETVKAYQDFINSEDEADKEASAYIKGIWFEEEYIRKYPYDSLAAALIGFTVSGNEGTWGLEGYYNDMLNGTNGREYGYLSEDTDFERTTVAAINGYNVVSTIDLNIQRIVEKYINQLAQERGSEHTGVIVADPNTGEILAMASSPTFNPNSPRDLSAYYTDEEIEAMSDEEIVNIYNGLWRNFCVSDTFEAGSTVKPLTIGAALDENKVSVNDTYMCDGGEDLFNGVGMQHIACHNVYGHGTTTLQEAIMWSCNDALMQIGNKLGTTDMLKYHRLYGFGQATGIDLPGEAGAESLIFNELLMMLRTERKLNREISLYEPIGTDKEGNEISFIDVVEDTSEDVVDGLMLSERIQKMYIAIDEVLNDREREIIYKRYGLRGRSEVTQREIGKMMGISRSYVSRIEKKALEKLRHRMADFGIMW